jgi:hypothetical protein
MFSRIMMSASVLAALFANGCAAPADETADVADDLATADLALKPAIAAPYLVHGEQPSADASNSIRITVSIEAMSKAPDGKSLSPAQVSLVLYNTHNARGEQANTFNTVVHDLNAHAEFQGSKLVVMTSANETFTIDGIAVTYSGAARLPAGYPSVAAVKLEGGWAEAPSAFNVPIDYDAVSVREGENNHNRLREKLKHVGTNALELACHHKNTGHKYCEVRINGGLVSKTRDRWVAQGSLTGSDAQALYRQLPVLSANLHGVTTPVGFVACGSQAGKILCVARGKAQYSGLE